MSWYGDIANNFKKFVDNWAVGIEGAVNDVKDGNIIKGTVNGFFSPITRNNIDEERDGNVLRGIGEGILGSVHLGEDLTEKNNINEISDADREALKNKINKAWDAARETFSDASKVFANGNIFTDMATDIENKDDLYDELTDEGMSIEDGAYLMQLDSMGKNSPYDDTSDVLRYAEYKYFLENATADNIMTPEFKAGALSYLRDVKDVYEAYGTSIDMKTEEHTKAYLDAAANVFPGGKERFYSIISDVNEIALTVTNYEDAKAKYIPGAPTSVYDTIEKNAYNDSPDWFKSMLDDDKLDVPNDTTSLLTFEKKFGKGPFESKIESKLDEAEQVDSKSETAIKAEDTVNTAVGGIASIFKSAADAVGLDNELKLDSVKNSDKAKNDEFLNSFDKGIRGNETSYEI